MEQCRESLLHVLSHTLALKKGEPKEVVVGQWDSGTTGQQHFLWARHGSEALLMNPLGRHYSCPVLSFRMLGQLNQCHMISWTRSRTLACANLSVWFISSETSLSPDSLIHKWR